MPTGTMRKAKIEDFNKQRIARTISIDKNENKPKTTENTELKKENVADDELPKAMQRNIKIENAEEISVDRTNDILNQINQYLDQEKKKMQ